MEFAAVYCGFVEQNPIRKLEYDGGVILVPPPPDSLQNGMALALGWGRFNRAVLRHGGLSKPVGEICRKTKGHGNKVHHSNEACNKKTYFS